MKKTIENTVSERFPMRKEPVGGNLKSLRYYSKKIENAQTYNTKPSEIRHRQEAKFWFCCNEKIPVRDTKGNLNQCGKCLKTYYNIKKTRSTENLFSSKRKDRYGGGS